MWEEISKEFQAAGLRPVTPDEEVLSTIHGITEDKARRVAAEQTSILERGEKDDIKEEHVMYSEVPAVLLRPIFCGCLLFLLRANRLTVTLHNFTSAASSLLSVVNHDIISCVKGVIISDL